MEEKNLQEYRKVITTLGDMYIDFQNWEEIEDAKKRTGGEIWLLKRREGKKVYHPIGIVYEPHDMFFDYEREGYEVFEYDENHFKTIEDVYDTCIQYRLENAIIECDYNSIRDTLQTILHDFDKIREFIGYASAKDKLILVNDNLTASVVKRYLMRWREDVYECCLALAIPSVD